MDWIVGFYILFGFLFFWGVWIFGFWLPMAREGERERQRELQARRGRERNPAVDERPIRGEKFPP